MLADFQLVFAITLVAVTIYWCIPASGLRWRAGVVVIASMALLALLSIESLVLAISIYLLSLCV